MKKLELIQTELTKKCPNCNSTYILIDKELVFCPGCALSILEDGSIIYEEEDTEKELVQI